MMLAQPQHIGLAAAFIDDLRGAPAGELQAGIREHLLGHPGPPGSTRAIAISASEASSPLTSALRPAATLAA
jgi:hypothetical protein